MIQIFIYVKGLTVQCYPGPHYSVYLGAAIADQCQARVETVWPIPGQDSEGQAGPVRGQHRGRGDQSEIRGPGQRVVHRWRSDQASRDTAGTREE